MKEETRMMTDKVTPREVTEKKFDDKRKFDRDSIAHAIFGTSTVNDNFNPNRD